MADYRLDCCGGFPSHRDKCTASADYEKRKVADERVKKLLDALYVRYGGLVAMAKRSSLEHDQAIYGAQADGFLEAIRIVEGK